MSILIHSYQVHKAARQRFESIVRPMVDEQLPIGVNPCDSAYVSGFDLGLSWEDADPSSDLSPHCQAAFVAGWDAGRREAEMERLSWCDRYEAELIRTVGRYEGEPCDHAGAQSGHDDAGDGSSFADELYDAVTRIDG